MHGPVAVDHDTGTNVPDHPYGQKERVHQGHGDDCRQGIPRMAQQAHRHASVVAHREIVTASLIVPLACTIHVRSILFNVSLQQNVAIACVLGKKCSLFVEK